MVLEYFGTLPFVLLPVLVMLAAAGAGVVLYWWRYGCLCRHVPRRKPERPAWDEDPSGQGPPWPARICIKRSRRTLPW